MSRDTQGCVVIAVYVILQTLYVASLTGHERRIREGLDCSGLGDGKPTMDCLVHAITQFSTNVEDY